MLISAMFRLCGSSSSSDSDPEPDPDPELDLDPDPSLSDDEPFNCKGSISDITGAAGISIAA